MPVAKSADLRIAASCVRLMAALALVSTSILPAAAQQAPKRKAQSTDDPFTVMSRWKPTADAPDMPDFVKRSRRDENLNYAPLTGDQPNRPKRMDPAELAAATAKMDAAAAAARARAAAAFPASKARRPASAE